MPEVDLATWTFRVFGEVEEELELDVGRSSTSCRASSSTQDIHCVTRWSRFDAQFEGVHWSELAKLCRPLPSARFAIAHAEHDFTANVPLAFLEEDDTLLVTHADGEPLSPITAGRCGWSSRASTLEEREVAARDRALAVDQPGFWERYGYHNDADPWKEERYSF